MRASEPVNILLVDDQPAKLLSYEAMLGSLGENLIRATSGNEALDQLLKKDIAVILMDVCMPELDGFELASMIRNHPRFHKTAIIHVSAVNLTDIDRLRGYNSGAVDYVSVPVVPEVLRAKVKVFADLYRKTEELKQLNADLELRVAERTAQLEATVDRLGRSEERFRVMAETVPSFLWTADANGTVTYVNQRWFDYHGSAPGDLRRDRFSALHPDDRERCREAWERSLREGSEYRSEARLRGKDGGYRWFLTHAVPQKAARVVTGWFGVSTDIHDEKTLAVELREGDRRKDEFLAMLAHELRNPLAAIRSALDVARHPNRSAAEGHWGHGVIDRQTAHLTRMIDDLLDVSRITRGKLELRREVVDLGEVVLAAVESGRPAIDQRGIELCMTLPTAPCYLKGDRVRICQVFLNLLDNATKYTPRGGRIELRAERVGANAEIRVKDTGIGIAAEQLPRLFELFFQINQSLERSEGGLGIGLTLAQRLVDLHGGTIEARSAGPGEGSEFVVTLPAPQETAVVQETSRAAEAVIPPLRILVADDNADSAEALAVLLRLAGHDVRTAHDGEEAFALAQSFRPGIALLDIGMPHTNGYDLARRLREEPWGKGIVLIAETGWGQEDDRRRTRDAGFQAHLVKPVDAALLMEILSSLRPGDSPQA